MPWIKSLLTATLLSLSLLAGAAETGKINLNTATAAELEQLDGIGKAKAEAIVQYRQLNGKFTTLEQLAQVKGIGAALLEKNRDSITLE